MTLEDSGRTDWISKCKAQSLQLVDDGKLERAVELFIQQVRQRALIGEVDRIEGLSCVSRGRTAVEAWLRKF